MSNTDAIEKQRNDVIRVLNLARDIYLERDEKYRGLWTEYGAEENIHHIFSKARRLRKLFRDSAPYLTQGVTPGPALLEQLTEDAVDMIVYGAFYVYCIQNGLYFDTEDSDAT